ncbi:pyridoxal-phosphate dependent enzyme [Diaphorobacter caeni]|uniref:pyridoxal-phosphate dependent enzyme n=1 Tax=Diaphorobacter caeni TaxID=2784387 RepID=UPI002B26DE2C|nr:pyridoxal-phosphate dependent enzyme [Diaphorobacter caeni]
MKPVRNQPRRPTLTEMTAARERISPYVRRTPLIDLGLPLKDRRIFVKLETLQPIGAFKLRPALSALLTRDREALAHGVAVSSSGNMAYGTAWAARQLGISMAAYMMTDAPLTKIEGVRKLGGDVRFISGDTWWNYITEEDAPEGPELLINPVTDNGVLAGNGSIGFEILEDLPRPDWVLSPIGGGSLVTGVASAIRALQPGVRVLACEGEHAAPATAALAAGKVVEVDAQNSFIKSIGGPTVVPALWPIVRELIDGTSVVTLAQVVEAMQLLYAKAKVVAEGAGAASLAAAINDPRVKGDVVCVISGGNIDPVDYISALNGVVPAAR